MKKAGLVLLFLLGLAAAGGLSAGVVAATTTTGTTTTAPATIASGVTISGVEVGALTSDQAFTAVTASFARPLTLVVPRHRLAVDPRALTAPADTALKLRVILSRKGTQRYLDALAKRFDREPVDSQLLLRNLRPVITKEQAGRFQRMFGVATGQSAYPTPLGIWHVVVKWRNPWWYPPNSPWAKGEKPVPPGPGNPLGTRWMGLSASGVGIHGTPDDASIGYSASHGCIRMHISDAEWLFNHVNIGTTVFVVSA